MLKTIIASAASLAIVIPPPPITRVSHAALWSRGNSVVCGIMVHRKGTPAKWLLCSAHGIPRPGKSKVGDPFVRLAATGKPQLVLEGGYAWEQKTPPRVLRAGERWRGLGNAVTCTLGTKTVTCKNGSKHGFTIGNGKYKSF